MARKPVNVETLTHNDRRANIPTAELESVVEDDLREPIRVAYARRNPDLDPQLVWRGKDVADWSDLVVQAPPLYIQEKIHPKALIDDLTRQSAGRADRGDTPDLFADFNGLEDQEARTEFYQHSQNWANRMILGDSLQVMASLAEREGLRGQVQCIYVDPPYGIRFNSNFQWSTTSRDVKDGDPRHITREPEQVKAFRDTWRDGIHSYLTYLRDRLTVARDLLADSGSIFVQIGDENVHRVREVMDEVFGEDNFACLIVCRKTSGLNSPVAKVNVIPGSADFILWYAKNLEQIKYRQPYIFKSLSGEGGDHYRTVLTPDGNERPIKKEEVFDEKALPDGSHVVQIDNLISQGYSEGLSQPFHFHGRGFSPGNTSHWKTTINGLKRLSLADRLAAKGRTLRYRRYFHDFAVMMINSVWQDVGADASKTYVVQTPSAIVQRCILMTTDPGDLVLDPTCGSGTTAYVAEQWGRRWITIDTSRVALALARARLMGARYPYYLLADSPEGQQKEAEVTRSAPSSRPTHGDIRHGFVYQRVPHITLKSIANNAEIDVIWERMQPAVEDALARLNAALRGHPTPFTVTAGGREGKRIDFTAPEGETVTLPSGEEAPAGGFREWEVPREAPEDWPAPAREALEAFWQTRIARQREIDASIAAKAEHEYLYDRPYEDNSRIRVAGPFTAESLSPHRTLAVDEHDELVDTLEAAEGERGRDGGEADFATMVLENLRASGVQQAAREDRISFTALTGWPGDYIAAEGRYMEGEHERRAGIFIGPEYGTVQRADLVAAAREAADAGFDVLVACAFNYDAHSADLEKLGRVPILKARMNPDLHMSGDLKPTGSGNLFVVFGEPDIEILEEGGKLKVQILGVDVFKPQTGEIESAGPEGIACWFIDTDYNEESFFVRHAYFLGASDPYKALRTTLKAEIDEAAWETLHSDVSRPFERPSTGRIAVKVINHLGDEVMKVFGV